MIRRELNELRRVFRHYDFPRDVVGTLVMISCCFALCPFAYGIALVAETLR